MLASVWWIRKDRNASIDVFRTCLPRSACRGWRHHPARQAFPTHSHRSATRQAAPSGGSRTFHCTDEARLHSELARPSDAWSSEFAGLLDAKKGDWASMSAASFGRRAQLKHDGDDDGDDASAAPLPLTLPPDSFIRFLMIPPSALDSSDLPLVSFLACCFLALLAPTTAMAAMTMVLPRRGRSAHSASPPAMQQFCLSRALQRTLWILDSLKNSKSISPWKLETPSQLPHPSSSSSFGCFRCFCCFSQLSRKRSMSRNRLFWLSSRKPLLCDLDAVQKQAALAGGIQLIIVVFLFHKFWKYLAVLDKDWYFLQLEALRSVYFNRFWNVPKLQCSLYSRNRHIVQFFRLMKNNNNKIK